MQYCNFSFFSQSDSDGNGVGSNKAKKTLKEKGANSKHEENRK
jgi:hypothetical protein